MKYLLILSLLIPTFCFASSWECINRTAMMCNTWRMNVIHGWLVASDNGHTGGEHGYAMTFVPDESHEWRA